MHQILNNILLNQGFLALTQQYPIALEQSFSFDLDGDIKISMLETGVLVVEPPQSQGKDIVISSGIHGNETAPIEIVDQLVNKILSGALIPQHRVMFIIGNPLAVNEGKRFVAENMNRMFSLSATYTENKERQRAQQLMNFMADFYQSNGIGNSAKRIHYDLHTAIRGSVYSQFAVYPYDGSTTPNAERLKFWFAAGIDTILIGHKPSTTFSYFSHSEYSADSFTVELGQVKPFGENNPADFALVVKRLEELITNQLVIEQTNCDVGRHIFQVIDELIKQSEKFQLNIADDVKNFTQFSKGFQLSDDQPEGYLVKQDGDAIVFPNQHIPVGQRAGLIVRRVSQTQEYESI